MRRKSGAAALLFAAQAPAALLFVACAFLSLSAAAQPDEDEPPSASTRGAITKKVALVVGAYDYIEPIKDLPNPSRDATDIANVLVKLGFELVGGEDATKPLINPSWTELRSAIVAFRDAQAEGSLALFYYAGHAIELGGANYLVPVGARLGRPDDADVELIPMSFVLERMAGSQAKYKVLLLDACRNDPFDNQATRSTRLFDGGLAGVNAIPSMFISYATEPGKVALDGPAGFNSPYTRAILDNLAEKNLPIYYVFDYVSQQVMEDTRGFQVPHQFYNFGLAGLVLNDGVDLAPVPVLMAAAEGDGGSFRSVDPIAPAADDVEEAVAIAKEFIRTFDPYRERAAANYVGINGTKLLIGYGRAYNVKPDDVTTVEAEEAYLDDFLRKLNKQLNRSKPFELQTHQRAALLSFMYNVGAGGWEASSLRRYMSEKGADNLDRNEVYRLFGLWNKVTANSKKEVAPALVTRRANEALLFLTGQPRSAGDLAGIELIKRYEGLELEAYQDGVGTWTVGYGHTGPDVTAGRVITQAEADLYLLQDLQPRREAIERLVTVPLDSYQTAALTSFIYNVGTNAFQNSTTRRRLNSGDYVGAAEAMRWWNKAFVAGAMREVSMLTRRRQAEAALFLTNVPPETIAKYEFEAVRDAE